MTSDVMGVGYTLLDRWLTGEGDRSKNDREGNDKT